MYAKVAVLHPLPLPSTTSLPVAVVEPLPQPVRGSTADCVTLSQLVVVAFPFAFRFLSLRYNWLRVLSK